MSGGGPEGSTIPEDLVREGALPGTSGAPALLIETHVSWVFVARTEVWKVKKPVDLGFLDFRTLAARKEACDAEVVLNRRLAPSVYLGVKPITLDAAGRHVGGGDGVVVDWAVCMRRLPDAWRASDRLMEGALSVAAVDSIASRLARFHEHAREDDRISRFGRPDVIRESVVENFAQTRSALCEHVRPCEAAELEAWQTGFLTAHEDVFVARMRAHRIRECHGDLRLEHVYLDDSGEITVLDGIEFNERFRFIDTSADIAFLSMDLAWHGRADLAERLLATYARDANDYDLFSVVDVYEGYRAHVRAKVSTFVERDERMSWEVRQRAAGDARRYFLLAIAAGRKPLRSQVLVAVGGVIASGKSTVASWIGAELGAPVVDADRTRKHLLGIEPTEHANDAAWVGAYDPAVTARVYREVLRRAGVVLASGRPVVIDASFRSKAMREEVRSLAQQLGVPWKLVECRTPPALCRHRLERRATAESVSDGRLDVFDSFAARFEVIDELNDGEHVVVDTSLPPEETARLVQDSLAAWPRDHGRAPVP